MPATSKVTLKRKQTAQKIKKTKGVTKLRELQRHARCKVLQSRWECPQRADKPVAKAWPAHELHFFDAPLKMTSPLLKEVMIARGWRYKCNPCHGTFDEDRGTTFFVDEFEASVRGVTPQKAFGKGGTVQDGYRLKTRVLPKHALWYLGFLPYRAPGQDSERQRFRDNFPRIVARHGHCLNGEPGNYRIAKFPGTERALTKINLTKAFTDKPWYPTAYVLPEERNSFQQKIRESPGTYWIGKPGNDYGGKGICVWKATDPDLTKVARESDGRKQSIVQSYLADPLLIGGYKSHMRIHLMITNLNPLQAYVQENGQCLFATKPYTLSSKTLGALFDPPSHVTNMCLNATPENATNYLKHKPVVGKGQQIRMHEFVKHLEDTNSSFDKDKMWNQILKIAADTVRYIGSCPNVTTSNGKLVPDRHFEVFGMDLMMDKNLKVWMCEVNTDPGMGYPDEMVLGEKNPDYDKELCACKESLHDMFNLLGLDAERPQPKAHGSLRRWFKLDFADL